MNNSNQTKQIITAGSLTGILLAVFLIFGGDQTADPTPSFNPLNEPTTMILSNDLQADNQSVQEAVLLMQERELQYQQQIEIANQTIQAMEQSAPTYNDEAYEEEEDDDDEYQFSFFGSHEEDDEEEDDE